MGSLTLPASGKVYVDTAPIIYSVERKPDYDRLLQPLWDALDAQSIEVVTSELTLLETLVKPFKVGDSALAQDYEKFLTATRLQLHAITHEHQFVVTLVVNQLVNSCLVIKMPKPPARRLFSSRKATG